MAEAGMVQAPAPVEMAPAVINPAAAPPNPDEKKTPEKIRYRGNNSLSLPESGEER